MLLIGVSLHMFEVDEVEEVDKVELVVLEYEEVVELELEMVAEYDDDDEDDIVIAMDVRDEIEVNDEPEYKQIFREICIDIDEDEIDESPLVLLLIDEVLKIVSCSPGLFLNSVSNFG